MRLTIFNNLFKVTEAISTKSLNKGTTAEPSVGPQLGSLVAMLAGTPKGPRCCKVSAAFTQT